MADPNLQYDPVLGWEDTSETVFKTNPSDAEVRPMFQRLFNQIKIFINLTLIPWITSTFATKTSVSGIVLGQIPPGTPNYYLHTKSDGSGTEWSAIDFAPIITRLNQDLENFLLLKLQLTGLKAGKNVWSDTIEDISGINLGLSSGYVFDSTNKSLKSSGGIDSYTKLMLHLNGNVTDSSSSPKTVTNNNVTYGTGKFGQCGVFNGTSSYLTIPTSSDLNMGNGAFTIDCWIKRGTIGTVQEICLQCDSTASNSSRSFEIYINASNNVQFNVYSGSTPYTCVSSNTLTDTVSFHHIEAVSTGSNLYLFVDGTQWATTSVAGVTINSSPNQLAIGRAGENSSGYFNGSIDEFRISKGVSRNTTAFTPPIVEYTNATEATIVWNPFTSEGTLIKAVMEAQTVLGTGTATYYFSRDGGTTFTLCTLDTITDISTQPNGTSIVVKVVLTGNAELQGLAWGGSAI